ncbi:MAG: Holliday junction branch migration protein RuvA [Alphaproteobacteria bacterium]|nr:Holliday junction branch migration protein RuvA [Alphaproteobacteria bacterium]
MIARLSGILGEVGEDFAIIDVGGVGYLIFCSARSLSRMPAVGDAVRVEVETHVREDHIHLYGFIDTAERSWFRLLTTVQGVGARVGLAILSVLTADELVQAVAAQDKAAVARANGVGPKLAGRIVTELRDKVGGMALGPAVSTAAGPLTDGNSEEAISALVNLGYARGDAFNAVAKAGKQLGEGAALETLIRTGLQEMSQ